MDIEKNKRSIMELILFTIVIIFAFINMAKIWSFIKYIIAIFMPFIIGVMIAFVLNVLLNVVENKLYSKLNKKNTKLWQRIKRPVSVATTFIIIIALLALVLGLIIPQLQNTATIFTENFDSYKKESVKLLQNIGIDDKGINKLNKNIGKVITEVTNYIDNNKQEIFETTLGVATSVIGTVTSFLLGLIFAIYILLKKEDLARQSKKILKAYLSEKQENKIKEIAELSNKTFGNFISGQCLEALIIGILCFVGMFILQIPYASTVSVLVGFTALIPVFGAFIGIVVGAFLILMVDPTKAIIFVIFLLLLQQIEGNLIYPKVVGKSVGLPSIWVMVAVTVGAGVAGILGMLISVPLCSIIYSILKTDVNDKLKEKATVLKQKKRVSKI